MSVCAEQLLLLSVFLAHVWEDYIYPLTTPHSLSAIGEPTGMTSTDKPFHVHHLVVFSNAKKCYLLFTLNTNDYKKHKWRLWCWIVKFSSSWTLTLTLDSWALIQFVKVLFWICSCSTEGKTDRRTSWKPACRNTGSEQPHTTTHTIWRIESLRAVFSSIQTMSKNRSYKCMRNKQVHLYSLIIFWRVWWQCTGLSLSILIQKMRSKGIAFYHD